MDTVTNPIIIEVKDSPEHLSKKIESLQGSTKKYIHDYPTIYIHEWQHNGDKEKMFEVYVGESNDIVQRTRQHFELSKKYQDDSNQYWQKNLLNETAQLYVIGHKYANKSLTLDLENRLIMYLLASDSVSRVHNGRGNPQNDYYTRQYADTIFDKIWAELRKYNNDLFISKDQLKDSAIFKASPFHHLTIEQQAIKNQIINLVFETLYTAQENQHHIIFIEGDAGTGKTVLNSSTFYELYDRAKNEEDLNDIQCYMLVNHEEQKNVYTQIAQKLGIQHEKSKEVVYKPTSYINQFEPGDSKRITFVDEGHLLLTQGKQSYRGKNQLQDIIDRSLVTVVMFDRMQFLTTEEYWEPEVLNRYISMAKGTNHYFFLEEQLRMQAPPEFLQWIDAFTKQQKILPIPINTDNYQIRIFDTPASLEDAIQTVAHHPETALSRMIATYDWPYKPNKQKKNTNPEKLDCVVIDDWNRPWNYEMEYGLTPKQKKQIKDLAWAEQPHTIQEVGSTFTIQGFDLSYAGVILGPSIKYRDGKIVYDPSEKAYKRMTQNRTLENGDKQKFTEQFIEHEVRILMTRGVKGLFIYACDQALRQYLLEMQNINNKIN